MKKFLITGTVSLLLSLIIGQAAFAGNWVQDTNRPANENGVTNWVWKNTDETNPKAQWAWIDGNGDGVCESYYFDADGYMLAAPAAPEGYTVNENGAWTKNGVVQAYPNAWAPGPVLTTENTKEVGQDKLNPLNAGYSYEKATHSTISDAQAYDRLMQIRAAYPEGTPWGDYETYVSGKRYGYGCAAFIFMVQDKLYGAPAKPMVDNVFDMSKIRVGDHLRVMNNTHSVIVLSKGDGYITVAEGAYYGTIHWGRTMTEDELRKQFVYRETCY